MPLSEADMAAIRKYAVKNAMEYGKAQTGSVLSKAISGLPELKSDIIGLRDAVNAAVSSVNKLDRKELESEYELFRGEFESADAEKAIRTAKPKMELEGAVVGAFATRFPPEPSGYLHIGHAKPIFLESEFTKIYDGKLFLYFDDTNPEKEKQEFVDSDKRDLEWLGIKFDEEYYASDHIEKIYEYARKLINEGNAYVCLCDQEAMKKKRLSMEPCEHRERKPAENLSGFKKMLNGEYEEGAAVLRFKGSMNAGNTALRDPTIARIKKVKHYRQGNKYLVWPTYDLAAPILDSIRGVTHVMRSKEYELRDELDTMILAALGLRVPKILPFARLNVKGNTTHKREIRKLIADGVIESWDDPRLMTLIALKRRGIVPEAIRELVLRFGMSKTDSVVPLDMLLAENRKIIDRFAKHLYFVSDPVRLTVSDMQGATAKMRLHPSAELGSREYKTGNTFFISAQDSSLLKEGDQVRLKDLVDIVITSKTELLVTATQSPGGQKGRVIHWVPENNYLKCSVMVPGELLNDEGELNPNSLSVTDGYVEGHAKELKEHDIVQFERFGYCILDRKDEMQFIFISG